jgi:hypothetical protein
MRASLAEIIRGSIGRVRDPQIQTALAEAYQAPSALKVISEAESFCTTLTSAKWSAELLARLLSGWRSTHGTALFVSGLVIRIQRQARAADSTARQHLFEAAAEMGEIISEDTGVDDLPHNELFTRFANQLVGDDRWQLNCYTIPASERFRNFVKRARLRGAIEEAILMTAASESWNCGEYAYLEPRLTHWMKDFLGFDHGTIRNAIKYVSHHTGSVESGHFLHAINAWERYCHAHGSKPDPAKAKYTFVSYLEHLFRPFKSLNDLFVNTSAARLLPDDSST